MSSLLPFLQGIPLSELGAGGSLVFSFATLAAWLFTRYMDSRNARSSISCPKCVSLVTGMAQRHNSAVNTLNVETLRDQMNHAESVFHSIEMMILGAYKKSLDALDVEPQDAQSELLIYGAFLKVQTMILKGTVRGRLKENHLTSMRHKEFREYTATFCQQIIHDTRSELSRNWNDVFSVPLAKNIAEIDKIIGEIEDKLSTIFEKAYAIAEEKQRIMETREIEYNAEIDKFLEGLKTGKSK